MQKFTKSLSQAVLLLIALVSLSASEVFAQTTTISGQVTEAITKETLVGVNIVVKGKVIGTISDLDGNFTLRVNQDPPLTLIFSMVGFTSQEVEITDSNVSNLQVALKESTILGQEIVVSASRVEESVLQSPVTIERMDIISIREAPQANFYDALNNMKGVEMSTQSLTFKSFNTRGFNANGNVRTVQLIDGMDNQAPGLNFSVGNIAGISELDLEYLELLPGASSALYGPNAINGILLMNSKNPFQYQGFSAQLKTGIMDEGQRSNPTTGFYDFAARYATSFSNKVALKVNVNYLRADDWQANDFRDQSLLNGSTIETGTRTNNPGFNGVNSYGDETAVDISQFAPAGVIPTGTFVSRTGYLERDVADYNTESLKLNAALHWRINDRVEAIIQGNYGAGTTVYTGADRYSITGFNIGQYKAELRGANWFLRAYTTQERSGDSYAVGIAAQGINEAWKPSFDRNNLAGSWFPQYTSVFAQAIGSGADPATAHAQARAFADQGRFEPGSAQFNQALADVRSRPIPGNSQGVGARFVDKTNLYHLEGSYTFEDIKFAEFVVGANYRNFQLNSEGTLFALTDDGEEFNIREYGGYAQGSKKLIDDKLKLTASVRYDKNENFDGQWSPRVSAVYTANKVHNFRLSYQTGFRIPTTQDQYIDLLTPQARLIGGLPLFRERYNFNGNPPYSLATVSNFGAGVAGLLQPTVNPAVLQGAIAAATSIVTQQVQAGQIPPAQAPAAIAALVPQLVPVVAAEANLDKLEPFEFSKFQPEIVKSYEFGYKGLLFNNKLLVDGYYYFNRFENFIGGQILVQDASAAGEAGPNAITGLNLIGVGPGGRNIFSMPVNRKEIINTYGWALGLDYQLPKGYTIGGNVSYNNLGNIDELDGFQPAFNTPEYRTNLTFANRNINNKNIGFALAWRWQDEFVWQSSFVAPAVSTRSLSVMPAFSTLDAQVSYKVKSIKSIIKVGGSNLFNSGGYRQAWGNPTVGTMYFVSITFDEFLN
ncbi:Outer membrane receptor for ferrienterochelin and colicins [Aquiflexum balticum DSM 16537]|uniref:Outer membrane receptor for ferrienterochelin and colicins n=1 Tax=Aquiflexum balticum DSM 16537 TaxID=758820 RepID=A0A1W2H5X3_9BACT|nr:TonB-dependent receptor [Aquiflexum balticum]SMD44313.1 Outer membrane receptor for ferrienterochelin and colicins [Aquiflexum balticum DSM 16537]